jgi:hypothetical protein
MNRCISNIGHISNNALADGGVGTRRRLNDTLRHMLRELGIFRVVLLPFLRRRDVRKYFDSGEEKKYYFGYSI